MPNPHNTSLVKGVRTAHGSGHGGNQAAFDGIPRYTEDDLEDREAALRLKVDTTNLPMCQSFVLPEG